MKKAFTLSPKMKRLHRSEVYGQALAQLLTMLRNGQEPRNPAYIFADAFVNHFVAEGLEVSDPEDAAQEEKEHYKRFRKEAIEAFPGLYEKDLAHPKSFFYIVRSKLRKRAKRSSMNKEARLRKKVIKLAYDKPELRKDLLPLLKESKQLSDVDIEEGKMHKLLGLDADQEISDYGTASAATKRLVREVGEDEAASMINYAANLSGDPFLEKMQDELKNID